MELTLWYGKWSDFLSHSQYSSSVYHANTAVPFVITSIELIRNSCVHILL